MDWRLGDLALLCLLSLAQACQVSDVDRVAVLGCFSGDREVELSHHQHQNVTDGTECLIETINGIEKIRCSLGEWKNRKVEVANKRLSRQKRGWWRRVGDFFVGVAEAVVKTVACVSTLMLACIFDGRAGPRDTTPPTIDCGQPEIRAIADPFQINTKVTWDEPWAYDDVDGKFRPFRQGREPGQHFSGEGTGRHQIVYIARDRSGNENRCSIDIYVEVIRCPPPNKIDNGYYTCHPSQDHVRGGWCRYGCHEGFEMEGESSLRTCRDNRTWDYHEPKCSPLKCNNVESIEGAGLPSCSNSTNFRSICTYNCTTGYDMPPKVSKTMVCDKDKMWRKTGEPKCIDVEAPRFNTCPSLVISGTDTGKNTSTVQWEIPKVLDNSREKIEAVLKQGYPPGSQLVAGKYPIIYGAHDRDLNAAPDCKFDVVVRDMRCARIYPTPYTHITCPDGYRTGSVCHVTCDLGKDIVGGTATECIKSQLGMFGEWNWTNHEQSTCKNTRRCLAISPPQNGAVACDNWLGGAFCQLQCQMSTDMRGVDLGKLYTCNTDGDTWWPTPPSAPCKVLQPFHQLSLGVKAVYYFDGDCNERSTQLQIASNFIKALENNQNYDKNVICSDSSSCNQLNVQVTCGDTSRTKRSSVTNMTQSDITILIYIPLTINENSKYSEMALKYHALYNKVKQRISVGISELFDNETVSLLSVRSLGVDVQCPEGTIRSETNLGCLRCAEGTYFVLKNGATSCRLCEKGTYQSEQGQTSCIRCPAGTTTRASGAVTVLDCEKACDPGSVSKDGVEPCSPCGVGFYQASYGQTSCHKCRNAKSTLTFGAVSLSDCREFDIVLPKEGKRKAVLHLHNVTAIDFTMAFWLRIVKETKHTAGNIYINLQNNDEISLNIQNLETIVLQNGSRQSLSFTPQDERWHQVSLTRVSCVTSVSIDGVSVLTDTRHNPCRELRFNTISIVAEENVDMSISQFNVWRGPKTDLRSRRCFGGQIGDIVAWPDFAEANLDGSFVLLPSACDDFDNCVSSPCSHGMCKDILQDFACFCDPGFTGRQCDLNIDDCEANICMNDASCVDGIQSYMCRCPPMFTGKFCEVKIVNGNWSEWGEWSECSQTCEQGESFRRRTCNNPAPEHGGQSCLGQPIETVYCNNFSCPTCTDLEPPANGSLHCEDNNRSYICTISCDDGFDFDIEPFEKYTCGPETFYEWTFKTFEVSKRQFPKCVKITIPKNLRVYYTAHYEDLYCSTEELRAHTLEQIDIQVNSIVTNLPCVSGQDCRVESVDVMNCDAKRVNRRSIETAGFTVTISSSPKQDEGNDTLTKFEETLQQIQAAADAGEFTVDVLDDDYELETNKTAVTGEITCGEGETRVRFYCVACGSGSYLFEGYCKLCDRGTYQDEEGRLTCKTCENGKSTIGVGSDHSDDCSVEEINTDHTEVKVAGIIVGSIAAMAVTAILIFVYRRYRSKQLKLVEPTDINKPSRSTAAKKMFDSRVLSVHDLSSSESTGSSSLFNLRRFGTFIDENGTLVHSKPWRY